MNFKKNIVAVKKCLEKYIKNMTGIRIKKLFFLVDNKNLFVDLTNEEKPRLRYGSNGIPILEPIPAPINFQSIKKDDQSISKPPIINLEDLNTDNLIAKVKSLVDFAK